MDSTCNLPILSCMLSEESGRNLAEMANIRIKLTQVHANSEASQTNVDNNEKLNSLETRIEDLAKSLAESQAVSKKCCKRDNFERDSRKIVLDWIKEMSENKTEQSIAFNMWLEERFLPREMWQNEIGQLKAKLADSMRSEVVTEAQRSAQKLAEMMLKNATLSGKTSQASVTAQLPPESDIMEIIQSAIRTYDADKTGMFDFALESAGKKAFKLYNCIVI